MHLRPQPTFWIGRKLPIYIRCLYLLTYMVMCMWRTKRTWAHTHSSKNKLPVLRVCTVCECAMKVKWIGMWLKLILLKGKIAKKTETNFFSFWFLLILHSLRIILPRFRWNPNKRELFRFFSTAPLLVVSLAFNCIHRIQFKFKKKDMRK